MRKRQQSRQVESLSRILTSKKMSKNLTVSKVLTPKDSTMSKVLTVLAGVGFGCAALFVIWSFSWMLCIVYPKGCYY